MKKLLLSCIILLGSFAVQAQDENIRFTSFDRMQRATWDIATENFIIQDTINTRTMPIVNLTDSVLMIQVKNDGFYMNVYGYDIIDINYKEHSTVIIAMNENDIIDYHVYDKTVLIYFNWDEELKIYKGRWLFFNKADWH